MRFHQFEKGTGSRIRYKRVNEDTGKEVDFDDIVKGAEVDGGDYVVLTREELESVEPGRTRTIDISDFVDASEIDPIHFQKSYYLAPREEQAQKPYKLLVQAMEDANRIGIATFVMRSKEYLAAIRPRDGVLVLETMFFADEVRDPSEEIVTESEAEPSGEVVDLLSALQASVDEAKGKRSAKKGGKKERAAGASSGTEPDLADLGKSDLYDLAQELDISGRSSMTRRQLIDALNDAGPRRKAS